MPCRRTTREAHAERGAPDVATRAPSASPARHPPGVGGPPTSQAGGAQSACGGVSLFSRVSTSPREPAPAARRALTPRDVDAIAATLSVLDGMPREEARGHVEAAVARGARGLVL